MHGCWHATSHSLRPNLWCRRTSWWRPWTLGDAHDMWRAANLDMDRVYACKRTLNRYQFDEHAPIYVCAWKPSSQYCARAKTERHWLSSDGSTMRIRWTKRSVQQKTTISKPLWTRFAYSLLYHLWLSMMLHDYSDQIMGVKTPQIRV